MASKKSVSLAVERGEKLPTSQGAGLTAKGRAKYNRFCARMGAVAAKAKDGERAKAALKRWKC